MIQTGDAIAMERSNFMVERKFLKQSGRNDDKPRKMLDMQN
jgi:hypothetical protein